MRRRILLVVVLALAVLALVSFPAAVRVLTEWWWYRSIGFDPIFVKSLVTRLVLGTGAGLLAFGFFYVNFRLAQRGVVPDPIVVNINTKGAGRHVDITGAIRRLALPVAAILAVLTGISASTAWLPLLRLLNQTPFGVRDPIFGRDVAFYVFGLPAVAGIVTFVQALVIVSLFLAVPLYMLRGDLMVNRNRLTVEPSAQRHLGYLIGLVFVTAMVGTYLVRIPSLLFSTTGPFVGASYTDLTARLPVLRVSGVLAALCGGWVIWGGYRGVLVRNVLIATVAYLGVAGVLGTAVPAAMQKLVVLPNELGKETPQLRHHIAATRRAWGIDRVEVRPLSGESDLTLDDIRANSGTINNVRLWDREPLLQTFGQLQEIRTYYDFREVDDDRYTINGEYRQVLLSPRELNVGLLPNRSFPNERLTFTHGMGLTMSPANQVTNEGLPVLFIKDLPPVSSVSLRVTRPEIYYGELSSDWVFARTKQPEFDYPSGDSSAFTSYHGRGGVKVGGWWRKLLLSARFQSLKIVLTTDITDESHVLMHRNIRERAARALPFLSWDGDPYIVVDTSGRLKWMLDGYTTSRTYPYATPALADGTNYMRNSVKVVIDAYDGTVDAYVSDPEDPIILTYDRIFPGLLQPLEAMPADLRAHLRYPEDLFRVQTQLYAVYHLDEPTVFYHREDQWQVPTVSGRDSSRDPFLRHIVMKLPGEEREEFIFMTPFTPRGKQNLAAWMVARNDGEAYGQLRVYEFPRQSLVFGPTQIVNRINQDTEISRQLSLWDQRGSEVIRGNLLVIPIEEALVFVQALYLRAEGGRIPELKRVVVAYRNRVVMEENIEKGLARLFGGDVGAGAESDEAVTVAVGQGPDEVAASVAVSVEALAGQAVEAYDQALTAQRNGNWAVYGRQIRRVGELLRRMQALRDSTPDGSGEDER